MIGRRETTQFNCTTFSEIRRKKKGAISFLPLKFQQNLRNTGEKKVHFSFIMHTKLAAITSKFGRSIMYDLVSCLIIHFGGTK